MMKKKSASAPAVDRALDVIELLAASDRDLALSEILKRVHIPRQSLIRILNTLCDRGIVNRADQRGFYRPGMKLLYLGDRLKEKIRLRSLAWPFMQELAEKTGKTIELSTRDRDQIILIEQIEGTEGVRLYSRVGSGYPYFHAVGVGKIYLKPPTMHKGTVYLACYRVNPTIPMLAKIIDSGLPVQCLLIEVSECACGRK